MTVQFFRRLKLYMRSFPLCIPSLPPGLLGSWSPLASHPSVLTRDLAKGPGQLGLGQGGHCPEPLPSCPFPASLGGCTFRVSGFSDQKISRLETQQSKPLYYGGGACSPGGEGSCPAGFSHAFLGEADPTGLLCTSLSLFCVFKRDAA